MLNLIDSSFIVHVHSHFSHRMLSFSNIYAHNAWLLLSPSSLCCDWSLGSVPLVTSPTDTKNLYSVALYVSLAVLLLRTLLSRQSRYSVLIESMITSILSD